MGKDGNEVLETNYADDQIINTGKEASVVQLQQFPPICNISETQIKLTPVKRFNRKYCRKLALEASRSTSVGPIERHPLGPCSGWRDGPSSSSSAQSRLPATPVSCFQLGFRSMNDLVEVCRAFSQRLSISSY